MGGSTINYTGNYYDEVLKHYGILGQKWGVRRYQNEDGTLTEAGKRHYKLGGRYSEAQKKQMKNDAISYTYASREVSKQYAHETMNAAQSTLDSMDKERAKTDQSYREGVASLAAKYARESENWMHHAELSQKRLVAIADDEYEAGKDYVAKRDKQTLFVGFDTGK